VASHPGSDPLLPPVRISLRPRVRIIHRATSDDGAM
jgi:hypothetical protein